MYEILERGEFKAGVTPNGVTKVDVLRIVNEGGAISVIDMNSNGFNISRFNKHTIKIYPIVTSSSSRSLIKNYIGRIEYPVFYDNRWVNKYTMELDDLPSILS